MCLTIGSERRRSSEPWPAARNDLSTSLVVCTRKNIRDTVRSRNGLRSITSGFSKQFNQAFRMGRRVRDFFRVHFLQYSEAVRPLMNELHTRHNLLPTEFPSADCRRCRTAWLLIRIAIVYLELLPSPSTSKPSTAKFSLMAASSLALSACCACSRAASRCIVSSNGSPSSCCASAPT